MCLVDAVEACVNTAGETHAEQRCFIFRREIDEHVVHGAETKSADLLGRGECSGNFFVLHDDLGKENAAGGATVDHVTLKALISLNALLDGVSEEKVAAIINARNFLARAANCGPLRDVELDGVGEIVGVVGAVAIPGCQFVILLPN